MGSKRTVLLAVLVCFAHLVTLPNAYATVIEEPTVERALELASDVVLGVVIESRAMRTADGAIHTDTLVRVDRVLAGSATPGGILTVRHPGGQVGADFMIVPGMPAFQSGERVVLLLTRGAESTRRTLGLFVGAYSVVTGEHGEEAVRKAPRGAHLVPTQECCGLPERMALAEFLRLLGAEPAAR